MIEDSQEAIREQLLDVFGRANYPVTDPFELIPALPDGPGTTFEAGGIRIGAMELGMEYADYQNYPYNEPESLVADLMTGLRAEGVFED